MGTSNMHRNRVKFSRVVFELCEQTDKQATRHTHHNISHPPADDRWWTTRSQKWMTEVDVLTAAQRRIAQQIRQIPRCSIQVNCNALHNRSSATLHKSLFLTYCTKNQQRRFNFRMVRAITYRYVHHHATTSIHSVSTHVNIKLNNAMVESNLLPRCHILTNSTKHCSCLTSNRYRHLANF